MADEAGAAAALAAAVSPALQLGARLAGDLGRELGAELGRLAGAQAAAVAAATRLAQYSGPATFVDIDSMKVKTLKELVDSWRGKKLFSSIQYLRE